MTQEQERWEPSPASSPHHNDGLSQMRKLSFFICKMGIRVPQLSRGSHLYDSASLLTHSHGLCQPPFHRQLLPEEGRAGAERRNNAPATCYVGSCPNPISPISSRGVQEASKVHSEDSLSFPGPPTLLLCQMPRLLRRLAGAP